MKIFNNYTYYSYQNPAFKSGIETIKHMNIGMMPNGLIGKIRVFKNNGQEIYLNVIKNAVIKNEETYQIQEMFGKIIGEICIKIKKTTDYDREEYKEDPSHVFIEYLRNYSRPETPYTRKGLEHYSEIGTRLVQIAQRRSDESCCCGNIELISKDDSKPFYEILGFEEKPKLYNYKKQNQMYLPPHAKEPLSKRSGGL